MQGSGACTSKNPQGVWAMDAWDVGEECAGCNDVILRWERSGRKGRGREERQGEGDNLKEED
jgi:hypothetical protein